MFQPETRMVVVAMVLLTASASREAAAQNTCQIKNRICQYGICDGDADPATVGDEKPLGQWDQGPRRIVLHVSESYQMGWASITNATPGDEVWLDRSSDGGRCWEERLGLASVPQGGIGQRTMMHFYAPGAAQLRACGRAAATATITCTPWLPVCELGVCDGVDPASLPEITNNPQATQGQRTVILHVAITQRMAWASIENGQPGDEVWLDRRWDGQPTWDGLLSRAVTPDGRQSWRTWALHFNDVPHGRIGELRACARTVGTTIYTCTAWLRSSGADRTTAVPPPSSSEHAILQQAIDALAHRYDQKLGAWREEQSGWWWQSPNALTTLLDYMIRTNDRRHLWIVDHTFATNASQDPDRFRHFTNLYLDDSAWWGLAWIRAYDLTRDPRYLDAAMKIADFMWARGWDRSICGGGLFWLAEPRPAKPTSVVALVKNAITNELYIKLAASIYNRSPANRKYRDQAHAVWVWFRSTAMIKDTTALVQDGLYDDGVLDFNGKPKKPDTSCDDAAYVWTYTQGVILGALVELSRAMGSEALLDDAAAIAGRALNLKEPDPFKRIVFTSPPEDIGLVREHCEEFKTATAQCACSNTTMPGCHVILPQNDHAAPFKGVFVRNLRELFDERRRVGANTYDWATLLLKQRDTLIRRGKSGTADFGFFWNKNQSPSNFAVQGSAIDALVAAHGLH